MATLIAPLVSRGYFYDSTLLDSEKLATLEAEVESGVAPCSLGAWLDWLFDLIPLRADQKPAAWHLRKILRLLDQLKADGSGALALDEIHRLRSEVILSCVCIKNIISEPSHYSFAKLLYDLSDGRIQAKLEPHRSLTTNHIEDSSQLEESGNPDHPSAQNVNYVGVQNIQSEDLENIEKLVIRGFEIDMSTDDSLSEKTSASPRDDNRIDDELKEDCFSAPYQPLPGAVLDLLGMDDLRSTQGLGTFLDKWFARMNHAKAIALIKNILPVEEGLISLIPDKETREHISQLTGLQKPGTEPILSIIDDPESDMDGRGTIYVNNH